MAAPGAEAVFPLADRISLRPEEEKDEGFLRRVYASTRADEMALTGWDQAQTDAFLGMQFELQRTHYRRHFSDASFLIILLDSCPVGRLYVHHGPCDTRLMDIALLPEWRGKGVGGWILETLLAEAARLATPVTLHVEPYNRALRLYERAGFQVVERSHTNLFMEWRPPGLAVDGKTPGTAGEPAAE